MSAPLTRTGGDEPVGLELIGLEKRYGDVLAVKEVTLSVRPGEFLTLLGPSGSGKTTTLNMVAGFEIPTRGEIILGDRDITRLPTHKRGLGMVFQSYALFPHLTVAENVMYPLQQRGGSRGARRARALEALESVSLAHLADRKPAQLSGGQQQRVALARAFVSKPPILLMDEPLSALDKALRTQMQEEIRRLHQELGTTVLFVTHDQEEALALSDRIVVMRDGEIAQVGSPEQMYGSPTSKFTASFLGAASFLAGVVGAVGGDGVAEVRLSDGRRARARVTGPVTAGQQVQLVLRPEDCLIAASGRDGANRFRATFEEIVYLGDRVRGVGRFDGGERCMAWMSHDDAAGIEVGAPVDVAWDAARCVVVPEPAAP